MRMDIKGAIRNKAFRGFTDDEGNELPPKIAEAYLKLLDYNGQKYLKIGDCDNWDDEKGCLGHKDNPMEDEKQKRLDELGITQEDLDLSAQAYKEAGNQP
jgi:hypothetical protein